MEALCTEFLMCGLADVLYPQIFDDGVIAERQKRDIKSLAIHSLQMYIIQEEGQNNVSHSG